MEKTSAIEFFQKHEKCLILIKETASRFLIRGEIVNFEEIDICSGFLFEATVQLQSSGFIIATTFHNDFLGIHFHLVTPNSSEPEAFFPYEIPYNHLILEAA